MRLQLEDGQEVELKFYHGSPLFPGKRATVCECESTIGAEDLPLPVFTHGISACNAADQFNKTIGRRIALTRAIAHFPRAIRTQIWKAYFAYLRSGQ